MQLIEVCTDRQIERLARLADSIWHEYFPSILSDAQIDYMVDRFLSVEALKSQIAEGYIYLLAVDAERTVGFTGAHPEGNRLFISKVYVRRSDRGRGYASRMHDYWLDYSRRNHIETLWLTINRFNALSLAVHQKRGFRIVRAEVNDIGSGYVMDDYILELNLDQQ